MNDDIIIKKLSVYKHIPWKKLDNNIINYLQTRFENVDNIIESYYMILNNIQIIPKCKYCGNYVKFCGLKYGLGETCGNKDCVNKLIFEKREKTILKTYGVKNVWESKEIQQKIKQQNLLKYGKEYTLSVASIRERCKETKLKKYNDKHFTNRKKAVETRRKHYDNYISDKQKNICLQKYNSNSPLGNKDVIKKAKQTLMEHYNVKYPLQSKEIKNKLKDTCINKYGVPCVFNLEKNKKLANSVDAINKRNETHRKNNSFNTSIPEDKTYNLLYLLFKNNIKRQYQSDEYPYKCDFYITTLNLYIECNYFWMHNKHLFNENNEADLEILNTWKEKSKKSKSYKNAIYTWTILDVKKYNIACKNKLNYKIFYTFDEFNSWYEHIKEELKTE